MAGSNGYDADLATLYRGIGTQPAESFEGPHNEGTQQIKQAQPAHPLHSPDVFLCMRTHCVTCLYSFLQVVLGVCLTLFWRTPAEKKQTDIGKRGILQRGIMR